MLIYWGSSYAPKHKRELLNPTAQTMLKRNHKSWLNASQDLLVSTFCLSIGLWVCHCGHVKPDVLLPTKLFHGSFGQVSPIISDNVVWITKTEDQLLQKLDYCYCIAIADWLYFKPLGELVNSNQKVGFLILVSFERTNHIKPPDCKRPSDRNHPEFLSRHMSLSCEFLTSITLAHPIETVSKSLYNQGS